MTKQTVQESKPLRDVCTFGIGGPARYFLEVRTVAQAAGALSFAKQHSLPFHILGKGSNTLFDDKGFNGVVILNKIDFFEEPAPGRFHVGGGYSFSLLGAQTARKGWAGLEFASGIPGTVGGAVFMNAGANGTETVEALVSIDFLTSEGRFEVLRKEELSFGYRYSSFQQLHGVITGATFQLRKEPEARQRQLKIIGYRKNTQPYADKSAGCIFRNPVNGSAGRLIDEAGLKGLAVGGAEVSLKHGNFIINKGGASSQEVLALVGKIKEEVRRSSGIELESEVRFIPFGDLDE